MAEANPPRVLFVTTDYPPGIGGLQTYSHRIATALPDGMLRGVLAGSDCRESALPRPSPGAFLAIRRGRGRWQAFRWSLWSVPWLRCRRGASFLLHMQWTTALPSLALRMLAPGTRFVVLVHGAELIDPGRPILAWIRRQVLANADAVVAGSRHTAEIVGQLGIRCRRLEIVPYGNPLEGVPPPDRSNMQDTPPFRLLCMHRLVARKGTALLFEALAGLKDAPWSLTVAGRGEEEGPLKEMAARLGLADRIRFLPPVEEDRKPDLLRSASLFILPSLPPVLNNHVEGLGLTLLEAQSQGLPVLAARTGGIPEAVQEGRTGVLFRAGDAGDLREKLADLLEAPELLRKMGSAGPAWVAGNFSWERSLARLAGMISEIRES